jgi:hypothetical protein
MGNLSSFYAFTFLLGITEQRQPCMPGWPHSMQETNRPHTMKEKRRFSLCKIKGIWFGLREHTYRPNW